MCLWKQNFSFGGNFIQSTSHQIFCYLISRMAIRNKIKLFESLLSYFHILGTFSPDSSKNRRLNQRNVFVLFIYIQLIVSAFAFTLFKAESLIEYGLNFYGYVTQSLCTFIVLFQIYRMLDILKFIENCELLIERSKFVKQLKFDIFSIMNYNFSFTY